MPDIKIDWAEYVANMEKDRDKDKIVKKLEDYRSEDEDVPNWQKEYAKQLLAKGKQ